jgi:membrane protein required for colicin V production
MTWFDYGVLTVLGLSLSLGALRGLVREMVSLAGWIAAFILATAFSGIVAVQMPASLGPLLSGLLSFLLIFAGVLLVSGMIGLVLSLLVRAVGLGFPDRVLGAAFGVARGVAIMLLAVLLGADSAARPSGGRQCCPDRLKPWRWRSGYLPRRGAAAEYR